MSKFDQSVIRRLCMAHSVVVHECCQFRNGGEMLVLLQFGHGDEIRRLVLIESNADHTRFFMRSILQWQEHIAEITGGQLYDDFINAVEDGVDAFPRLVESFHKIQRKVESVLTANSQS